MPTIQDQIEKLRKKVEGYRALREDLGEAADQKIVELETQIQTLVETGAALSPVGCQHRRWRFRRAR